MLNLFTYKKFGWSTLAVGVPLLFCVVFEWNIIDYPNYAKGPCYSPNHAYYVMRHQTIVEAFHIFTPHDFGTARLFDRSGNLLYEKETMIDEEFGPIWSSGSQGDPKDQPQVFYQGTEEPGWKFLLPKSPGRGSISKHCHPIKID